MKIQDIIFLCLLILSLLKRDVRLMAIVGLLTLALSIPLFANWIFFTAERLTWYAASFFLLSSLIYLFQIIKNKENEK